MQSCKLTTLEELAWGYYCRHTAGCLSAKDFWWELSETEQRYYKEVIRQKLHLTNLGAARN